MFVLHEYNWNVLPFLSLVNLLMIIVYLGTLRDYLPHLKVLLQQWTVMYAFLTLISSRPPARFFEDHVNDDQHNEDNENGA